MTERADLTAKDVAKLARLDLNETEAEDAQREMDRMLLWMKALDEVDVSGIEPTTTGVLTLAGMRPDVVTDEGKPEEIIGNAPASLEDYFVVPKYVEEKT